MKKKQKRSSVKDIVYDDDTSSSSDSENIQSFQQTYNTQKAINARKYSSDADDEVNEDTSEDSNDVSGHTSSSSSEDEMELQTKAPIISLHSSSKMNKLRAQLKSLSNVNLNTKVSERGSHKSERGFLTASSRRADDEGEDTPQDFKAEAQYNKVQQKLPEQGVDKERVRNLGNVPNTTVWAPTLNILLHRIIA